MTQFPELFTALAAEFESEEVRNRSQAGRQLNYITARTAMNRLDNVLGPENWWDEYIPGEHSVVCKLTVRLPDGSTLTKSDAGGYAGMADQGDDDKSGFSDAFKRAAVKFGVGRYLYRDGVAKFPAAAIEPPPAPAVVRSTTWDTAATSPRPPRREWAPQTHAELLSWIHDQEESFQVNLQKPLSSWARTQSYPQVINRWSTAQIAAAYDRGQSIMAGLIEHQKQAVG